MHLRRQYTVLKAARTSCVWLHDPCLTSCSAQYVKWVLIKIRLIKLVRWPESNMYSFKIPASGEPKSRAKEARGFLVVFSL